MLKKLIAVLMVMTLSVTVLSGCVPSGKKGRNDILGRWTVSNFESQNADNALVELQVRLLEMLFYKGVTIEFINHKKVNVGVNSVDYQWLDKNKIQIGSDNSDDTPIVFDVEIDKDTMVFTNSLVVITLSKGFNKISSGSNVMNNSNEENDSNSQSSAQLDQLIYDNDLLKKENDQLKEENKKLIEDNKTYKSIVDARELLTVDHDINEKFANAYGIDERPIVHGLEFAIKSVGEGTEYNGSTVENGTLVYVDFEYLNKSIEDQTLAYYTMTLIESDGTKYEPHFQKKNQDTRNVSILSGYQSLFFIKYEDKLAPKFSDDGVVIFNVAQPSDSYLLQVEYNNMEVAYFKIK